MAPYRVNFINKDDAGSVFLALLKQIAYPAGAYADKHFYEVRTRDGEERNVRFTGNCTCQQSFTGSRGSNQQDAFGNASAQLLELLRLAQELDDLAQLFFRFIHAGHVFKGDLFL